MARNIPLIYTPAGYKSMKEIVTEGKCKYLRYTYNLIHSHSIGCIELKDGSLPDLSGYIRLNDNILDHILLFGVPEKVNYIIVHFYYRSQWHKRCVHMDDTSETFTIAFMLKSGRGRK